jgi:hypothetical protein
VVAAGRAVQLWLLEVKASTLPLSVSKPRICHLTVVAVASCGLMSKPYHYEQNLTRIRHDQPAVGRGTHLCKVMLLSLAVIQPRHSSMGVLKRNKSRKSPGGPAERAVAIGLAI